MTDEEIRTGLAAILEEVGGTDPAEVTMEKSFINDLDVDSLLLVEVVVAAEERFGVTIPEDGLTELTTVADFVKIVQGHLATV